MKKFASKKLIIACFCAVFLFFVGCKSEPPAVETPPTETPPTGTPPTGTPSEGELPEDNLPEQTPPNEELPEEKPPQQDGDISGDTSQETPTPTPHEHTPAYSQAIAATCSEVGWTVEIRCADCGETLQEKEEIPKVPHEYGAYQIEEDGHFQQCLHCENTTEKAIHAYEEYRCTVCGYENYPVTHGLSYERTTKGYTVIGMGQATAQNVWIPSEYNGKPVTKIANNAFNGCRTMQSVVIPHTVTSIGAGAFGGTNLREITLPFLGEKQTTLQEKNKLFGYIFGETPYLGGVKTEQTYAEENLTATYYLPQTLKKVTLTGGSLLKGAFSGCSLLEEIVMESKIKTVSERAFASCTSLKTLTLCEGVEEVKLRAFYGCTSLEEITFPDSLKKVGEYAFEGCISLQKASFGSALSEISPYAFFGCTSLEEVSFEVAEGWCVTQDITWQTYEELQFADGKTLAEWLRNKYVAFAWARW